MVSFEGTTSEGVQGTHSAHTSLAAAFGEPLRELRLPLEPGGEAVDGLLQALEATGKRPLVLMRRAHVYATQHAAIARVLERYPDALLVSAREPFDAFAFEQARHVLCIYGDDAPSIEGLADVLFAGEPASGTLPVARPEHALE